jgi:hypothetical protein
MGGEYIIIDDPLKNREDAASTVIRDKLWEWYTSTLYTRLEKDGCILLTMTRWHEDDLAGRLLRLAETDPAADQWEVLNFPAIAEKIRHTEDIRDEGDALWVDKYPCSRLDTIKAAIGAYDWNALYQQRPAPTEGGLFGTTVKIPYGDIIDVQLQTEEQVSKDVTLTRLLLIGVLAFGAKKKTKTVNYCLVIEYKKDGIQTKGVFSGEKCNKLYSEIVTWRQKAAEKAAKNAPVEIPTAAAPVSDQPDAAAEIAKFKSLLDRGAITQDEYDAKKKQLLGL